VMHDTIAGAMTMMTIMQLGWTSKMMMTMITAVTVARLCATGATGAPKSFTAAEPWLLFAAMWRWTMPARTTRSRRMRDRRVYTKHGVKPTNRIADETGTDFEKQRSRIVMLKGRIASTMGSDSVNTKDRSMNTIDCVVMKVLDHVEPGMEMASATCEVDGGAEERHSSINAEMKALAGLARRRV